MLAAQAVSAFKGKHLEKKALNLDDVSDFDDVLEPENERFGEEIAHILNDALHIQIPTTRKPMENTNVYGYTLKNPLYQSSPQGHNPVSPFKFNYPYPNIGNGDNIKHGTVAKVTCINANGEPCNDEANRFHEVDMAGRNRTVKPDNKNSSFTNDYIVERFALKFVPESFLLDEKSNVLPKYNYQPLYGNRAGQLHSDNFASKRDRRRKRNSHAINKRNGLSDEIIRQKIQQHLENRARNIAQFTQEQTVLGDNMLKKSVNDKPPSPAAMHVYLTVTRPDEIVTKPQTSSSTTTVAEDKSSVTNEKHTPSSTVAPVAFATAGHTTKENPLAWEDSFLKGIYKTKTTKEKPEPLIIDDDSISDEDENLLRDLETNEKSKRCIGNCKQAANHSAEVHMLIRSLNGSEYSEAEILKCLEHHLNATWCLIHYLYHSTTLSLTDVSQFQAKSKNVEDVDISEAQGVTMQKAIATKANFTIAPLSTIESLSSSQLSTSSDENNTGESTIANSATKGAEQLDSSPANVATAAASIATTASNMVTSIDSDASEMSAVTLAPPTNHSVSPDLIKVCAQMLESKMPSQSQNPSTGTTTSGIVKNVQSSATSSKSDDIVEDVSQSNFLFSDPGCDDNDTSISGTNATITTLGVDSSKNLPVATSGSPTRTTSVGSVGTTKVWLDSEKSAVSNGTVKPPAHKRMVSDEPSPEKPMPEVLRALQNDLKVINELESVLNSLKESNNDLEIADERAVRKNTEKSSSSSSSTSSKTTPTTTSTTENCYAAPPPPPTTPPPTVNASKVNGTSVKGVTTLYNNSASVPPPLSQQQVNAIVQNATNSLAMNESVIHYPKVDLKTNELFEDPTKLGNQTNSDPPVLQVNQINALLQNIHDTFGGTLLHLQEHEPEESESRVKRGYEKFENAKADIFNNAPTSEPTAASESIISGYDQLAMTKTKRFLFQNKGKNRKKKRKKIWRKLHGRESDQQPFLGRISQNSLSTTQNF